MRHCRSDLSSNGLFTRRFDLCRHPSLFVALLMSVLFAVSAAAQSASPSASPSNSAPVAPSATVAVDRLAEVLRLDEVIDIMRDEGKEYARELEIELMPEGAGQLWQQHIARVYNAKDMRSEVTEALENRLTPKDLAAIVAFFDTKTGQEILRFENAARRAMQDPAVEDIAWQQFSALRPGTERRLALHRFVRANDLLERNVAGALNANAQFFRGMTRGGALAMNEDEILRETWGQEQELREDTEKWLFGFLHLAYQPLSDAVLDDYIRFSKTPEGQALNTALFEGFDSMYRLISYRLGLGAAIALSGSTL